MMNFLKILVAAFVLAMVFNPSAVQAKEGVIKRKVVVVGTKKNIHKMKAVKNKRVAEPAAPKEPFLLKLGHDYTAAELSAMLQARGLVSVQLDDCWRGDTSGIGQASMRLHTDRRHNISPDIAPVIWHSFEYYADVVAARKNVDLYTKKLINPGLALGNPGSVERWNPYMCGKGKVVSQRISDPMPEYPNESDYVIPPPVDFPDFLADEAIWVMEVIKLR